VTTLAFEGRITCDNGRESFEIVGEGGDPSIHIGSIRIARRIARDFGPLFRSLPGLAGRQPVLLHIGPRLRARLGGEGRSQKRAAIIGRLLGLPLRELWYAPRTER
jgi:hypothetical protein